MDWLILGVIATPILWLYALAIQDERAKHQRRVLAYDWLNAHRLRARLEATTLFRFLFPRPCKCRACEHMRQELKR